MQISPLDWDRQLCKLRCPRTVHVICRLPERWTYANFISENRCKTDNYSERKSLTSHNRTLWTQYRTELLNKKRRSAWICKWASGGEGGTGEGRAAMQTNWWRHRIDHVTRGEQLGRGTQHLQLASNQNAARKTERVNRRAKNKTE